jgi:hypothetical protein
MWILIFIVLFGTASCTSASVAASFNDCATNLGTLEEALYESENNLFQLNQIFYPPSEPTTIFIRVNYIFGDECNVTYIWAIGAFLFLQPPTLFKYTSLFFYYPSNELTTLSLQLPNECMDLITENEMDGNCSCKNDSHMLNILTQQVRPLHALNNMLVHCSPFRYSRCHGPSSTAPACIKNE